MEKAMAPHSSTLAWKIPWTEEPGRLQSMGSQRVRHDWVTSLSFSHIGEGNGNPLQCSCLENPRDRGTLWTAVSGVAQSQTRLKWLIYTLKCDYWIVLDKVGSFYPPTQQRGLFPFILTTTRHPKCFEFPFWQVKNGTSSFHFSSPWVSLLLDFLCWSILFSFFLFKYLFGCAEPYLWCVGSSSMTRDQTKATCIGM